MEFFDEAECWSRDQIEQTQLSRLRSTVAQTRKCDFYRQRLDEAGVGADSIRSLDGNLTHLIGLCYILKTHISRHAAVFLLCKKSIFPISFIVSIYSRGG